MAEPTHVERVIAELFEQMSWFWHERTVRFNFLYTNWRGETAERCVDLDKATIHFLATEWHPEPQWILNAFDLDKRAVRSFAIKDMQVAWPSVEIEEISDGR